MQKILTLSALAGLFLAACNTTQTNAQANTQPLEPAETVGIDFASMPIGTTAHYSDNRGGSWQEVYRGKQDGYHVMEYVVGNEVTRTLHFHDDGTLFKRIYAEGKVRTFEPRSCMRVLGDCQYTVIDTKPSRRGKSTSTVTQEGSTYAFTHSRGSRMRTIHYELGQYNLAKKIETNNHSVVLDKITYSQ